MIEYLKALLRREPVRIYVYGVFAAVLPALVVKGYVSADYVPVILAAAAAVLAVPAVEKARSKVDSPVTAKIKADKLGRLTGQDQRGQ